jgi:hypothetical protein
VHRGDDENRKKEKKGIGEKEGNLFRRSGGEICAAEGLPERKGRQQFEKKIKETRRREKTVAIMYIRRSTCATRA